jgi:predicted solute-binding protein
MLYDVPLSIVKARKLVLLNEYCEILLCTADCNIKRYDEQVSASTATSLTAEQYLTMINGREAIRVWCEAKQSAVDGATTLASLTALSFTYGG